MHRRRITSTGGALIPGLAPLVLNSHDRETEDRGHLTRELRYERRACTINQGGVERAHTANASTSAENDAHDACYTYYKVYKVYKVYEAYALYAFHANGQAAS